MKELKKQSLNLITKEERKNGAILDIGFIKMKNIALTK